MNDTNINRTFLNGEHGGAGTSALISAVVAALVTLVITVPIVRGLESDSAPADAGQTEPSTEAAATPSEEEPSGETVALEDSPEPPVAEIADAVLPSVASVDTARGSGSAVIYRSDGYLVTNFHVVQAAGGQPQVTLASGEVYDAEIVGTAEFTDLAVLQIDAEGLPAADFASQIPGVGSLAVAIGSPFGLDATVTSGVVSALNRSLAPDAATVLGDLIQTDAAINPGNSGGALANADAEVIGINTAIAAPAQQSAGIGFAIPSTTVVPVVEQLIEEGEVIPAFLGIRGQNVDQRVAELYDLGIEAGAAVVEVVPQSPADDAGLQRGDVIVAINGEPVSSMVELAGSIRAQRPGDEVTLTYVRDGEEATVEVTLGETPASTGVPGG